MCPVQSRWNQYSACRSLIGRDSMRVRSMPRTASSVSRPSRVPGRFWVVWLVVPFAPDAVIADLNVAILFFIAITSISALGVVMAGYASRSSFSLLGALRGAGQMISYEVPLILSLLGVVMLTGSLSLVDVVNAQEGGIWNWYVWPQLPMFVAFFIAGLAEVKRVPFDLPEGESEIVGGYMVEYSGMTWALIQAAEF